MQFYVLFYDGKFVQVFFTYEEATKHVNYNIFRQNTLITVRWKGELFTREHNGRFGKFECSVDTKYTLELFEIET